MSEKELILLKFKKMVEKSSPSFYYFTLDICEGLSLISCANDETSNNKWWVELDNSPSIKFEKYNQLKKFIEIVNQNKND